MKVVLSISGGGIRGLIPILIIQEFERKIGDKLINHCDLISGTSTGGIISCLLNLKDSDSSTKYNASSVVSLYKEFGNIVFKRSFIRKILTFNGLIHNKYSVKTLETLLKKYFGDKKLDYTYTNMIIPSYQISNRPYPFFFKTKHAKNFALSSDNPYLWEVARSTSAANSYFQPYKMSNEMTMLDGGIFANNPAMCAYAEAKKMWKHEDIIIISIGTGENLIGYPYEKIKNWGLIKWAVPFFRQTSISSDETVKYMLNTFTNSNQSNDKFFYLQANICKECMSMDDASEKNIKRLEIFAKQFIQDNEDLINDICKIIVFKK